MPSVDDRNAPQQMTPFQHLRLWARRAPVGERATAGIAAAIMVAALSYLLVPPSHDASVAGTAGAAYGNTATGPGSGNGPSAATAGRSGGGPLALPGASTGGPSAATGSAPGGTTAATGALGGAGAAAGSGSPAGVGDSGTGPAGSGPGGRSNGTATTPAATAACPQGTDQGLTSSQIKVAIMLVDIAGAAANNVFGIPSTAQQQAMFDAVIGSMNATGGIACRKIVPVYFTANPADQSDLQQKCIDAGQSGSFVAIDPGSYSQGSPICFAQEQLPYFGGYILTQKQSDEGYPYLFDLGNEDRLLKDTIFGYQARGEFSPAHGFKKLGVYYHDCSPELIGEELAWLHQVGIQDSQIVTFDLGCPTAFAPPSDIEQAILKFQSAGVTDVTDVNAEGDFQEFTTIAQQQGFHPQYTLPDEELLGISSGTTRPNSANIANALVVTASRNGEQDTPGLTPTAGTEKCSAYMQAHGLPPVYQQEQIAGDACNEMWMLQAAAEHAPALKRAALAEGLQAARSIDFSYPQGPNDFSGNRVTTAGQFWRVDQFFESCTCWRVVDPTFHPSF